MDLGSEDLHPNSSSATHDNELTDSEQISTSLSLNSFIYKKKG